MSQNQTANWWISSPSLLEDDQGGSGPVAPAFLIVGPPQNENPNDSIRPWRDELLALRQAEKTGKPVIFKPQNTRQFNASTGWNRTNPTRNLSSSAVRKCVVRYLQEPPQWSPTTKTWSLNSSFNRKSIACLVSSLTHSVSGNQKKHQGGVSFPKLSKLQLANLANQLHLGGFLNRATPRSSKIVPLQTNHFGYLHLWKPLTLFADLHARSPPRRRQVTPKPSWPSTEPGAEAPRESAFQAPSHAWLRRRKAAGDCLVTLVCPLGYPLIGYKVLWAHLIPFTSY